MCSRDVGYLKTSQKVIKRERLNKVGILFLILEIKEKKRILCCIDLRVMEKNSRF